MMKNKYYFFIRMKKYIFSFLLFLINAFLFGQTVVTFNTSGNWTVPAGVTSITVEVWGGGGAGGGTKAKNSRGGGGGAGGAYVSSVLSVTPGTNINFTVGAGANGTPSARHPRRC